MNVDSSIPFRMTSRPTRARGLKPHVSVYQAGRLGVAPHAGAWIETAVIGQDLIQAVVAPHAGAWIETDAMGIIAGALTTSRPTRARGLKRHVPVGIDAHEASRPTRARGLKLVSVGPGTHETRVAPHAGAWIETVLPLTPKFRRQWSRPTRARGLKPPWHPA